MYDQSWITLGGNQTLSAVCSFLLQSLIPDFQVPISPVSFRLGLALTRQLCELLASFQYIPFALNQPESMSVDCKQEPQLPHQNCV